MDGLIDVVVPVRNAGRHLETLLATARANAPDGCRYLIVDDGSEDDTFERLRRAQRSMPYLDITRLDRSGGVAAARNLAVEKVSARYLAFLDADDWMAPGQLESLIAAQQRTGAAVVRTDHVRVDGFRRVPENAPWDARDTVFPGELGIGDAGGRSLVDYAWLWAGIFDWSQLRSREHRFDETLRTASDRLWIWRLHLSGLTFAVVSSPGYFYRRSADSGSLTEGADERLLDFIPALRQAFELADAAAVDAYRRRAAFTIVRLVAFHLRRRARLAPEWRRELVRRSAMLLASVDDRYLLPAIEHVRPAEAELARRLQAAGRRWSR